MDIQMKSYDDEPRNFREIKKEARLLQKRRKSFDDEGRRERQVEKKKKSVRVPRNEDFNGDY
jgi:hypothetical protein